MILTRKKVKSIFVSDKENWQTTKLFITQNWERIYLLFTCGKKRIYNFYLFPFPFNSYFDYDKSEYFKDSYNNPMS